MATTETTAIEETETETKQAANREFMIQQLVAQTALASDGKKDLTDSPEVGTETASKPIRLDDQELNEYISKRKGDEISSFLDANPDLRDQINSFIETLPEGATAADIPAELRTAIQGALDDAPEFRDSLMETYNGYTPANSTATDVYNRSTSGRSTITRGGAADPLFIGKEGETVTIDGYGAGEYVKYPDENGTDIYVSTQHSRNMSLDAEGKVTGTEHYAYTMNDKGELDFRGTLSKEELLGDAPSTHLDGVATEADLARHESNAAARVAANPDVNYLTASAAGVDPAIVAAVNPSDFPNIEGTDPELPNGAVPEGSQAVATAITPSTGAGHSYG